MTLPFNISNKQGLSFATICGLSLIAISMAVNNTGEISDATNLVYVHKAEALPHPVYDLEFEIMDNYIVEDKDRYKELQDEMKQARNDRHKFHIEIICELQQVKDSINKVPETICN